jgi:hypothetical protein
LRRDQTASSEARVEVQAGCEAIDVVAGKPAANLVEVVLVQLLRVVELIAVVSAANSGL